MITSIMIDKDTIKKLIKIAGKDNISIKKEDRILYSYDASRKQHLPDIVIHPASTKEVSDLLKIANEKRIPVTPRGAGAGFTGGSVPIMGGILMVMNRMNRIRELDTENMTVIVEPGVVTEDLQHEVERHGLFYPPDPASKEFSTIGGNVAESAGGPRAFKYGVTPHYVLGLEAVLADGTIIKTGSRTIKNVVGYNLTSLIAGSEGTLAVITAIILKLIPKPAFSRTSQLLFNDLHDAASTVSGLIAAKVIPTTIEIMDDYCVELIRRHVDPSLPPDVTAALIIECDGSPAQVEEDIDRVREIAEKNHCSRFLTATEENEVEELWKIRRSLSTLINRLRDTKINEDVVVPRSRIPNLFAKLKELSARYRVDIPSFGHAGDGNIHVNFMYNSSEIGAKERVEEAVVKLFEYVVEVGGSISGEHGIGLTKKSFLSLELSEAEIDLLRRIKRAFDPNNILNPGKIFPE